ncbi:hypothetical protein DD556_17350 [Phaeobacter sp. JL2872]|jgi:Ca2+-binding RTX toxin-like protein|uniref:nidogen-like domain-containing protein n=1 Tax=Phaeobacter sp. JL2872 TaxID=2461377 RepID=UPI000D5EB6AE|nr:nidogen-like domain-containing protein [Phaeobacter sp. JL2872]MEE2635252.1 nidogen-like domain-containing protein [Pseudomonadota bacterium]PVZ45246.1 hypothetical protein DD556_17350 [Phaeobacter sp. JL2872]
MWTPVPGQPIYVDVDVDVDAEADVVTITWEDVGFYDQHAEPSNSFQMQFYDRGEGDFDIAFRYEDINWSAGTASGGDEETGLSGSAKDRTIGNNADNELRGGDGNDLLIGGGGGDTFVFSDGDDRVRDFSTSRNGEVIDLSGVAAFTGFSDVMTNHASDEAEGVMIRDLTGNSMLLEGLTMSELNADDFLL